MKFSNIATLTGLLARHDAHDKLRGSARGAIG